MCPISINPNNKKKKIKKNEIILITSVIKLHFNLDS